MLSYEIYQSAEEQVQAIAARLKGVEVRSSEIPTGTIVLGFAGVMLGVTGLSLLVDSLGSKRSVEQEPAEGLLPANDAD